MHIDTAEKLRIEVGIHLLSPKICCLPNKRTKVSFTRCLCFCVSSLCTFISHQPLASHIHIDRILCLDTLAWCLCGFRSYFATRFNPLCSIPYNTVFICFNVCGSLYFHHYSIWFPWNRSHFGKLFLHKHIAHNSLPPPSIASHTPLDVSHILSSFCVHSSCP